MTGTVAITVGPSGSDVSHDQGQTWQDIDDGSFDTVDCAARLGLLGLGRAGSRGLPRQGLIGLTASAAARTVKPKRLENPARLPG